MESLSEEIPIRVKLCVNKVSNLVNLPGDVLELGVGNGINTISIAKWLKDNKVNKKVYACDTFAGLPYVDPQDGDKLSVGKLCYEHARVIKAVKDADVEDMVVLVKGLVEETLPGLLEKTNFCFVFMDMDLYRPTSFAIKQLTPILPKQAIIGFHDFNFHKTPGIKQAVNEINKSLFERINIKEDVLFFRKR